MRWSWWNLEAMVLMKCWSVDAMVLMEFWSVVSVSWWHCDSLWRHSWWHCGPLRLYSWWHCGLLRHILDDIVVYHGIFLILWSLVAAFLVTLWHFVVVFLVSLLSNVAVFLVTMWRSSWWQCGGLLGDIVLQRWSRCWSVDVMVLMKSWSVDAMDPILMKCCRVRCVTQSKQFSDVIKNIY